MLLALLSSALIIPKVAWQSGHSDKRIAIATPLGLHFEGRINVGPTSGRKRRHQNDCLSRKPGLAYSTLYLKMSLPLKVNPLVIIVVYPLHVPRKSNQRRYACLGVRVPFHHRHSWRQTPGPGVLSPPVVAFDYLARDPNILGFCCCSLSQRTINSMFLLHFYRVRDQVRPLPLDSQQNAVKVHIQLCC
jgi:hypothetical protein